jgi:hypothetical protein
MSAAVASTATPSTTSVVVRDGFADSRGAFTGRGLGDLAVTAAQHEVCLQTENDCL